MKRRTFLAILLILVLAISAKAATYPKLDISGQKKYEYKQFKVEPARNYFLGLSQIGGFYPTYSGGPWQERLTLLIVGKLSENLAVAYDLEQQPETPDKYNVKVNYDNHELSFGDITADFSGNDFASARKSLNGVMFKSKDSWYDLILVPSSKNKSQTQNLTSQRGNNTRGPYSLGHGSIVSDSEYVELNGSRLIKGKDYTIDYFEGRITFVEILTSADEFKYTYEYTNVLDLFFPTMSNKDFLGFQNRFAIDPNQIGKPAPTLTQAMGKASDSFPTTAPAKTIEEVSSTGIITKEGAAIEAQVIAQGIGFNASVVPVIDPVYLQKREEENIGKFRLTNTPIARFSEQVKLGGYILRRNEDYTIDYRYGILNLITPTLPSSAEPLVVNYQYPLTSREVENIAGFGSRGPYSLSYGNIITDSEYIKVDAIPYVRNLDYIIDYTRGLILFNSPISETSQINATYTHKVMYMPKEESSPYKITLGTTYLQEIAKKGSGAPTATVIESRTAQDVTSNDSTIYLGYFPIVPTEESSIVLKINGVEMTYGIDYVIPTTEVDPNTGYSRVIPETKLAFTDDRNDLSDGFDTGTIKMLTTLNTSDEVTIIYTYYKSIVAQYNGSGNGSRGPYYIRNYRNVVPGSENVQVWIKGSSNIETYTRNSSFEPDAGVNGYSISYYKDNPYIYFNEPLDVDKNYSISFQYIASSVDIGSDIQHDVLGVDASVQAGDNLKVSGAFARSQTDHVVVGQSTIESFFGNETRNYTLHAPNDIIENSELIKVNNYALNKDIDYYISYTTPGQIAFYYITPSSSDAIVVEYQYESSSGVVVGADKQNGSAYKMAAETKFMDVFEVAGDVSRIESSFKPMGTTPIPIGSEYKNWSLGYKPSNDFMVKGEFRETHDQITTNTGKYYHGFNHKIYSDFTLSKYAKAGIAYRRYDTGDDLLSGSTLHTRDSLLETWSGNIDPHQFATGEVTFNNINDFKITTSKSDIVDRIDPTTNRISFFHTNNVFGLTKRFTFTHDYQVSENIIHALTDEAGTTVEAKTSHNISRDLSYDFNLDLTFGNIEKWSGRIKLIDHKGQNMVNNLITATKNETYHMDFVPIKEVKTAIDHNRQESLSVVNNGRNPKTQRTAANAAYTPFNYLSYGWSGAWDDNDYETGAHNQGRSNTNTITYQPIKRDNYQVNTQFTAYNREALAPSGSAEVTTNTESFKQDYSLNYKPWSNISIIPGFVQEDYFNQDNALVNQVLTKTQNQTTKVALDYYPITVLSLNSAYNLKVTKNLLDDINRHKSIIGWGAIYKFNQWGTLSYNWDKEDNKGEVQAGSLQDLDLIKTTDKVSINITLPQENTILSSVGFKVSYKRVDYVNNKTPDDNFVASLLEFEGSLNF